MKKWILIGIIVIVVIIGVGLYVGVMNLGPLITTAVNTYGPEITKTEVRLGGVDVSLLSAEAKLKDFFLGNPEGFESPQAMRVGSVRLNIDEKSLTKDTLIIDMIEVIAPEITYEKARGTDNFRAILNNVTKGAQTRDKPSVEASEEKGKGKKLLIRNFIVKDGKVNLAVSMVKGKTISASLPDIHLKNLGKEKEGASPGEIFEKVMAALYKQITGPAVTDILNKSLADLGLEINLDQLGTNIESVGDNLKKELKGLKEEEKEKIKDAVEDKLKSLFE
jgi:uncharacterized protein involved in outer membrane biogenesis